MRAEGQLALASASAGLLPEDQDDRQPYSVAGGRTWLVFDGRIDNREELGLALALRAEALGRSSDAQVAALAWERWGPGSTERLLGDYALAVWDGAEQELTLVRGPLSHRSLFYAATPAAIAFSSSLAGLAGSGATPVELDGDALVGVLAGGTHVGTAGSLFRSVRVVRQGYAVRLQAGWEREVRIWDPPEAAAAWKSVEQCGEALQAELDRAVEAQLRRAGGRVGAHLSSGRDSGAVAATAARRLGSKGEQLLAYTGAPREGFAERAPPNLLLDESRLAVEVAALHGAIRHRVCRRPAEAPLSLLENLQRIQAAPLPTPSNLPWWLAVNAQAAADGATVLLTGQAGNYSVSAGGPAALRDLAREGEWELAIAGAKRFRRGSGVRNAATRLLGPMMPPWLYAALRARVGGGREWEGSFPLLHEPWRSRAEALRRQRTADRRPPASYRGFLRESLLGIDNGERMSAALFGLDVRDPTADRRLMEMVCSFPAAAWYGRGERPAFERAFADRLPREILYPRRRGYQQTDWFEQFTADEVRNAFRRYSAHPFVAELIDDRAVDSMVEAWPRGTDWMAVPERFARIEDQYRNQLLPTLAVAAFIWAHFPW